MVVRDAVQKAREHLDELFYGEEITDVGLEEVVFDEESNEWKITIGFSRPWDRGNGLAYELDNRRSRSYKVIRIDDGGKVKSLTDRVLPASQN